ncbi:hypothetical protein B5F87_06320 [Eubacterium sp. An3]|nr:hypothetical protein B5F87_06320 [Eubacterium sp. An3]
MREKFLSGDYFAPDYWNEPEEISVLNCEVQGGFFFNSGICRGERPAFCKCTKETTGRYT